MKPAPFNYARPDTLREALELLAADEDAVVLAGGQSLIPLLNLRMSRPSTLVDITRIEQLTQITDTPGELVIGAAVRQVDAERDPAVLDKCPMLPIAIGFIGHTQIRSRGTIGGSLAHADPSGELGTVCVALDATVVVSGFSSTRDVPAAEFLVGPYTTALAAGEIVTAVRIPHHSRACAFVEFARREGDFALMSVAAAATFADDQLQQIQIAVGSIDHLPHRLTSAEEMLVGTTLDDDDIARGASSGVDALRDEHRGTQDVDYRQRLARALIEDALREVADGRSDQ